MPTLSKSALVNALVDRTRAALQAADKDHDGNVDGSERATLPSDVKTLARSTADAYLDGGPLPISQYLSAYRDYVRAAVDAADKSPRDSRLTESEQRGLPAPVYASVVALRAGTPLPSTPPSSTPPSTPPSTTPPASTPSGSGVLGISGTKGPSSVSFRPIVTSGLDKPTGIAFNPHDGSLWIVNRGDDSSVKVPNPLSSSPSKQKFFDDSNHFMNNPTAIAFSNGLNEFATVQETTNDYNSGGHGNMFMGPTLWPATSWYDGGSATHLDMLHHSPNAMGITAGASSSKREYWVFNGYHGSIDRYFFNQPHTPGGDDHSDGLTIRYAAGAVKRTPGVPSHLALDTSGALYAADTGNGRIVKLDTKLPTSSAQPIHGEHDETPLYNLPSSVTQVTGASAGLVSPSGLVLHQGKLVVSDYATGHIKVFTKDGALVGDLNTGLGANALTGLAVGPNGKLFIADAKANKVLEITVS